VASYRDKVARFQVYLVTIKRYKVECGFRLMVIDQHSLIKAKNESIPLKEFEWKLKKE